MRIKSRGFGALAVCLFVLGGIATVSTGALEAQDAGPAAVPTPVVELDQYKGVDVHAGVFNDGQAALWDLNIIDSFRLFGAASRAKGYAPEQPINFSHVVHVQKNKMDCQYCHWSVSKAAYAAIPEVETCMGCHKIVKTDSPEIKKLKEYYDAGKPVPWVKVHVMPDHVYFNHKRHVKAGVSCHECHGQIPRMPVVERVSTMKMGWCIDCHRQKGTSIDCYTCHK
jgi:hypothetical protein